MLIYNRNRSKNEILLFMILKLLIDGSINSNDIIQEFSISSRCFYRYISDIKSMIYNCGLYYIDVYYSKEINKYLCKVNCKFNSSMIT